MPRAKKKIAGNSKTAPAARRGEDSLDPGVQNVLDSPEKPNQVKSGQRKRGWRDIEAISERARLKKMLVDIWHEDIELDEDIFGDSDHLSGYYTDLEDEEVDIEIDDDLLGEEEDFEEKEE
jgi:hypothetical protein